MIIKYNRDVTAGHDIPPKAIKTRSGRRARFISGPTWNPHNEAFYVFYEHDSHQFSLYWPSMTFWSPGGESHPLDYSEVID